MTQHKSDLDHLKSGVAVLATCIVQTLHESDPTFQTRFLKKLTDAYYDRRDNGDPGNQSELELLSWTRQLLTGFSPIAGQGKPFLED